MNRILIVILVLAAMLFPLAAGAATVPRAANSIAQQLDSQLMMRYAGSSPDLSDSDSRAVARSQIIIMGTTPANLNNLEKASPLARQMTEEISRWLVNAGYRYLELKKGKDIRLDPKTGEFILTRNVSRLSSRNGVGQVILAGTYVLSGEDVRFSVSLISVNGNEVVAKGTASVPITPDLLPLLAEGFAPGSGLKPSTYTRLQ